MLNQPKFNQNGMSSKTRKKVESQFKASGFDKFSEISEQQQRKDDNNRAEMKNLFFNPANRNMNNTFSGFGRGRGGGYYKMGGSNNKVRGSDSYGERILDIEKMEDG